MQNSGRIAKLYLSVIARGKATTCPPKLNERRRKQFILDGVERSNTHQHSL